MGDPGKEKWDTEKMREHRNKWSLGADTQLLSYMQQFSQNVLSETHSTLKALDSLESDVATACVDVSNVGNRFWALSDTQFVENRVYDDDDDLTSPTSAPPDQGKTKEVGETVVIKRLTEAIKNGINVLDTKFEKIEVPDSDSEDEEDDVPPHSAVLLKPVNRYKDRPLPHLIGSAEFRADDTLGLRDAPSDEETEEFMSASDKAYDESENSDIESDQTKAQEKLAKKGNNSIITPLAHGRALPREHGQLQTKSTDAPVIEEEMSGEADDDLFPQPSDKKSIFSSWQPSDLWAPDDDVKKDEDEVRTLFKGDCRSSSAGSSVSSAKSSNMFEPVKKTREEFGKSGSGRLPVFVQDDQDDLFRTSPTPTQHTPTGPKQYVPAGGKRIFDADINPFSDRNQVTEGSSERLQHKTSQEDRWGNNDEKDIFSKTPDISSYTPKTSSTSSIPIKKKETDLFAGSESEDDLFSSNNTRQINPPKIIENSSKSKNVKETRDSSAKSQHPSKTHRSNYPSKSEPSLFSDSGKQTDPKDDDDDLFSSSGKFTNPKFKISQSLFSDDLFKSEDDDLFSNSDISSKNIPKNEKTSNVHKEPEENLFSNMSSQVTSKGNTKSHTSKAQSVLEKDLFSDDFDLFGEMGVHRDSGLFGSPSVSKNSENLLKNESQSSVKSHVSGLFDDAEDDTFLFGSKGISSVTSEKRTINTSDEKKSVSSSGQPVEARNEMVKNKPSVLRPKRALERRSLFESDSDDDLFSSPQGSLSSRKSWQTPSSPLETKDQGGKKQPSSLHKGQISSKAPKTDFSSIFSDNLGEESDLITSHKVSSGSCDLFGEDKDLFYNPNVNLKTPDLFKSPPSDTVSKQVNKSLKDPLLDSTDSENKKENDNKNIKLIKTIKPDSENLLPKQHSDTTAEERNIEPSRKSDIFDDSLSPGLDVVKPKKPEPPKSLDIKSVTEDVISDPPSLLFDENEVIEKPQKPSVSKKPVLSVPINKSKSEDVLDGEVISPASPSKEIPGKLKASQLIKINPAALLPGARPRLKQEQALTPPEPEVYSHAISEESVGSSQSSTTGSSSTSTRTLVSAHALTASSETIEEEDMPPKSSPLQSVIKERAKIQGKRRPPSRRARQEAIRSSSIEVDSTLPPSSSFNLMSPSTDEEDLFSVPPLDIIVENVKAESPASEIFGTPTVLSPVAKQKIPSSFVSTPFVRSQPPPLDEEEEEVPAQDEDIFESEGNLFKDIVKEKKTAEEKSAVQEKKVNIVDDLFKNIDDDSLFSDVRERPPPLLDDDEEDDPYDSLFMSSNKSKKLSYSELGSSFSTTKETITNIEDVFHKSGSSTKTMSSDSLLPSSKTLATSEETDDSLFTTKTVKTKPDEVLFPSQHETDDSLFEIPPSSTKAGSKDAIFPANDKYTNELISDSLFPSESSRKPLTDDSIFTVSKISAEEDGDSDLFVQPVTAIKDTSSDSLFPVSSKTLHTASEPSTGAVPKRSAEIESKEDFFTTNVKTLKEEKSDSPFRLSDNSSSMISDDSLFFTPDSSVKTHSGSEKSNIIGSDKKQQIPTKKYRLFSDDEDEDLTSGDLFKSKPEKKVESAKSLNVSLFGDEDDDDEDIFSSSAISTKSEKTKKISSSSLSSKTGTESKTKKSGASSSSKPVKLEAKQTFSDPLLSNKD